MQGKMPKTIAKAMSILLYTAPLIFVVVLTSLVSCSAESTTISSEPEAPVYVDITPEEAYEMISQQQVLVLDVRTEGEYKSGYISDALLIPVLRSH